jgi:hypothetical protein
MFPYTPISVIPILYISTHVCFPTMHIHKKTDDDEKITWAPNYSRFVFFSMVPSEVNDESVYMSSSNCFVVTATREISADDRIVLYDACRNE